MAALTDETKRVLTYVLVTIAGGLLLLDGVRDGSTFRMAGGTFLAVAAVSLLVIALSDR